jgi:casein kinase 1
LLGRSEKKEERVIYVVDFGMAKHYVHPQTKQHIPYKEKKSLSGTARYMSINTHLGREQSRRDDMEALGNVFMYFLRGMLPWQGMKARDNREKYEKIGQKKQAIRVEDLCTGFPEQFALYVAYSRRLAFEEEPDYEMCRNWFKAVYEQQDPSELFDWEKIVKCSD